MKNVCKILSVVISSLYLAQANAAVTVIDFDKFENNNGNTQNIGHGRIIDNEYKSVGVNITSVNVNNTNNNTGDDINNLQVAFDTNLTGTVDPDLEYNNNKNEYNGNGQYSYTALNIDGIDFGNTPNNVLILQNADDAKIVTKNRRDLNKGECNRNWCETPNDENGTNPAGYFEFTFDTLVDIISLDTLDIEDNGEFVIQFFAGNTLKATRVENQNNSRVGQTIDIFDSPDHKIQAGEETLLTMGDGQFVRQLLNITGIDRMRIQLPGSGAIDNLAFRTTEVPAPATLGVFALALLFMSRRMRK